MRVKNLAELLVVPVTEFDQDEDLDGEWYSYPVERWRTPTGDLAYDYESALGQTINWLNSEYKENKL